MISLVHISDLHFDDVDEEMIEHLHDAITEINPTVVVVSGDLTLRGTPPEFERARQFLARINRPVLCVPGNHDVPAYNLFERFLRPFRRYDNCVDNVASNSYESEHIRLLGLNSARGWGWHWNWSHGRLSQAQIHEANLWFSAQEPATWRGLVVHHPFEIPEDMPRFRPIGRGTRMLQWLARRRVHFILAGHLHRGSISVLQTAVGPPDPWHITVIQAPTATSPRLRKEGNAFNLIQLNKIDAVVTAWVWNSSKFIHAESNRLVRTETGLVKVE